MKKDINRYIQYIFILIVSIISSCESGFEEENIDPNNPTSVPTAYLMSSAQRSLITNFFGRNTSWGIDQLGMRYMQMWANTLYTSEDRYEYIELNFQSFYNGGLADLEEIIKLNSDEETKDHALASGANANQIAVAKILKAWTFQKMTDVWGDIPYSEALKGIEIPSPAYDEQSAIYSDLIAELDEATSMIDFDGETISGDLIYGGNMEYWKLFAQSLKLRIGMRMSKVDPTTAQATVSAAINAGVFTSIDQDAKFVYLSASPNNGPWNESFYNGTPTLAVATTIIDKMLELEDPRIELFAQKAVEGNAYIGMPYGVTAAVAGSITNNQVSLPGLKIVEATNPAILITYSEVLFIQAEAAAYGWISGDPETLYKEAITASMESWGIGADAITTYLESDMIAYDVSNSLKSIGEQKWIAFYMQGLEAWSSWRRLGYPELIPAPDAVENRDIPRRRGYPTAETSLNQANYQVAVERQGPDLLETRIWWDVE
ncbi:SusD/RagB family nutrient-binding outer membrane lipoprotein [Chondrinema litorale]|uniref:SusD/RagB family nutrient-binding outer membrane lipoprotein n=1 Tax=Chondrinema litorale TaxID=2994555 RepID=UPI0025434DBA|nr:SusD/RagB family nutrient-binding outer membrane lipoprotein [Chondrinema litorale]UZR94635.1 SusD/RagB family nutrient-binding outer membrane lipoprotein [Chondrinema litorale]